MAPRREPWLKRRATVPSMTSVSAAVTKRTKAVVKRPRIEALTKNGTISRRRRVRRFGTVRTRARETAAGVNSVMRLTFRFELIDGRLAEVERLPLCHQQVLFDQAVDQPGDCFP